ncbi:MAG: hypothetical protein LV479_06315 [Methylacidiphilales bacterium]|nr:hypothetical protein [Candidatus Methylacidiphilales bacterium]
MPPEITACLEPGEEVLWHGKPRPYVFILRGLPNIAFGVTWGVLGAFWYHGAGGIGQYSAFEGWWKLVPLFSIPFILAGFSFFLRPIRLGLQARRTWYLVTNRRVFIAELVPNQSSRLRVFSLAEMAPPHIVKRPFDDLYDVVLTQAAQGNPHLTPRLDSGFFGIRDGNAAAEAINSATNP